MRGMFLLYFVRCIFVPHGGVLNVKLGTTDFKGIKHPKSFFSILLEMLYILKMKSTVAPFQLHAKDVLTSTPWSQRAAC